MVANWHNLLEEIDHCRKCPLYKTRNHVVPGEGNPRSPVMLVGEGPGREEDLSGRPFVGPAGQLLDKMLAAVQLRREDVYICNVVKCRPPGNRTPESTEAEACLGYLRSQFVLIQPRIILCLGATAARYVMDPQMRITRDRGVWQEKKGVWMLATYHPAALLRDQTKKYDAWEDLQALQAKMQELRISI